MYTILINSFSKNVNPALVEDYMRSIYGTLDSVTSHQFKACIRYVLLDVEAVKEAIYGDNPTQEYLNWEHAVSHIKVYAPPV